MASVFTENLVGSVLDGRYALDGLVGIGGSARVYRATDRRLGRLVAVKVLHSSFADDEAFVRRFRREAEALAPLNHPNIVTIYDVNDGANATGDPPYLVTEYLSGGTLLDLLETKYVLSPSQAARLALDAARGLEFAHGRGLVHRDIKPANLLFGEDQHVRVADFGLATVLADFSRTMQGDSQLGSPRYQSPEQARGVRGTKIDGRSDVYSLALVVVEAMTGSVPFDAESWAGQAINRLEGSIPLSDDLGALAPIIAAAGTRDPEDRVDAAGLVRLLEAVVRTLPRAASLPLDGSRLADRRVLVDRDPTIHVASLPAAADVTASPAPSTVGSTSVPNAPSAPTVIQLPIHDDDVAASSVANERARRGGVFDITLDEPELAGAPGAVVAETAATVAPTAPSRAERRVAKREAAAARKAEVTAAKAAAAAATKPDDSSSTRRGGLVSRRSVLAVLAAVALVAGGVGVVLARRVPTHDVPSLQGKTFAQARRLAASAGRFEIERGTDVYDAEVPSGAIVSQEPEAGTKLAEKKAITVVVSKGVEPIKVPDLSGLSADAASGALRALNLRIQSPVLTEDSDTVPEGTVIRWTPTDTALPGSIVTVVVSSGPPTVTVPNLASMTEADALAAVPKGLVATVVRVANDAPKGTVYATKPAAGEVVAKGAELKVFVSTGPAFAVVPNVIGLLPADASAALRKAGFKVGNTIGPADQPVLHTRPLRNTKARVGAVVTLYTTEEGVPEVPGVAATATTTKPADAGVTASTLTPTSASPTTAKP